MKHQKIQKKYKKDMILRVGLEPTAFDGHNDLSYQDQYKIDTLTIL